MVVLEKRRRLTHSDIKLRDYLRKNRATQTQLMEEFGYGRTVLQRRLSKLSQDPESRLIKEKEGRSLVYSCRAPLEEIAIDAPYELPETTIDSPFEIGVKDEKDYKLGLINTIYAGGQCDTTLVKNAFRYFNDDGVDAVVIAGGNSVWIDLTRYSKYKPDRTANSKIKIDPDMIKYPEAVRSTGRDPETLLKENKPVYITFKERLDMTIEHELAPLLKDDEGRPLYDGPIYMTFGDIEEELARQHTNEVVRTFRLEEEAMCNSAIASLRDKKRDDEKALNQHQKRLPKMEEQLDKLELKIKKGKKKKKDKDEPNEKLIALEREYSSLSSEFSEFKRTYSKREDELESDIKGANSLMSDWKKYKSRIIMTNTDEASIRRTFEQMKGYIIERIESAIPNCKVISTGTGHVKVGDKVGKIVPSPNKNSTKPSDSLMDRLVKEETTALHQGEKAPDFVVGGGLSPNFTYLPVPVVEPEGEKVVAMIQLPTCLDSKTLEEIVNNKVKVGGSNMAKIATKKDLSSGAVVLQYVKDDKGKSLLVKHELREEFLKNEELFKTQKGSNRERIFYELNWSDQHHGSKYMALTETKDDVQPTFYVAQGMVKGMKAPIVRINFIGDEDQEMNYPTYLEDHPDHLEVTELDMVIEEIMGDKSLSEKEKIIQIHKRRKLNDYRAGIISPCDQLIDFVNNVDEDLLRMTLKNADDVGFYGPSVLFINGNHNAHTADGMYVTSKLQAYMLKLKLGMSREEIVRGKSLVQRIMAPMLGNVGIYSGLFGIAPELSNNAKKEDALKDQRLYGEYLRHKMEGKKRGDRIQGQRTSFSAKGQSDANTNDRFTISLSGHDHMGGQTQSKHGLHLRSYCFMERNAYGEKFDFGAPTIGFMFLGLPEGGIDKGPIVSIDFTKDYIDHYANKKPKVPVEKIFKNPVIPTKEE